MIITDVSKLIIPCDPCETLEEGIIIAHQLFEELKNSKIPGIGLAANQIGIDKQVFVMNVYEKLAFVNPQIISQSNLFEFKGEGCLSFPGDFVTTKRYNSITISSMGTTSPIFHSFGGLEAVCVQHEIDHLMGIIMHERQSE